MQSLRGFWNNYGGIKANIFHVAGEIHLHRKPVCIPSQAILSYLTLVSSGLPSFH
jgi:hypothetical protein